MITYEIQKLIELQRLTSGRSRQPGIIVISKNNLLQYLNSLLPSKISLALLNQAIRIYCTRGFKVNLVLGAAKYNLIAEKVPEFLDWFLGEYDKDPDYFLSLLLRSYERWAKAGSESKQKDQEFVNRPIFLEVGKL